MIAVKVQTRYKVVLDYPQNNYSLIFCEIELLDNICRTEIWSNSGNIITKNKYSCILVMYKCIY